MTPTPGAVRPRDQRLEDRVVLITGAGGNLGRATVAACRDAGARLVLVDREHAALAAAVAPLAIEDPVLLATDLADPAATRASFAEALALRGRIDAVLHLAGGFLGVSKLHETSDETWRALLDMNLNSTFSVASAALPSMLERGRGTLTFIAARAGLRGPAGLAAYSASQSGDLRLTESLAEELQGTSVRVNCLLPVAIAPAGSSGSDGTPADAIADVLVFLASDAARAIHGAAIAV